MPKECNCYHNEGCEREMVCDKCGRKADPLYPMDPYGCGIRKCYCKECHDKYWDSRDMDDWMGLLYTLSLDKIHCIKCTQMLTYKDTTSRFTDECRTSLRCPKCGYQFTLYYSLPEEEPLMEGC